MTKHNRIIAELMDALDLIKRTAEQRAEGADHLSLAYISGVAQGAMSNCNAHRVRNSDGYLVVPEPVSA